MAANRFATMVHRSTNKVTLILIYAVLEWLLIILLLLNSLFSYLILKFAEYFGLKLPCLWCTRVDHLFHPGKNPNRDLLCELHAREVSSLRFCLNHHNLVESKGLCQDCLSSLSKNDGELRFNECKCCGVSLALDYNENASLVVETPSWDVSECACNLESVDELQEGNEKSASDSVVDKGQEERLAFAIMKDKSVQVCGDEEDAPPTQQHLEFFLDYSGNALVPVELVEWATEECTKGNAENEIEDNGECKDQDDSEVGVELRQEVVVTEEKDAFVDFDINVVPECSMEMEEDESSLDFLPEAGQLIGSFTAFPLVRWPSDEAQCIQELMEARRERRSDYHSDIEEVADQGSNENEADVSIGTEIPDLDIADEMQAQDSVHSDECIHEDPSTCDSILSVAEDSGYKKTEEQMVELQSLSVHYSDHEMNETEEDKFPDTPTSVESLSQLHKKLLMLERRDSGAEDSVDGSVTSELEGSEGIVTIEHLKSALRVERKALQVLYAELEEERSASAVAANQTMAMINRLQEEKAAMQMEALQYQRMMEEQSEYDQEALQLLNELMVRREREKQELERELDGYRKKLSDYVARDKMRASRRSKDGSARSGLSSASCSEDSDGQSIDLNLEVKKEEGLYRGVQECSNGNTPVDAVVNLEESLADFEGERLSILEQLKVLEERLLRLDDEKEQHFEDVDAMQDCNGMRVDEEGHSNQLSNGFTDKTMTNGKCHQERRIAGQKGKSLLPLFDAMSDENGDASLQGNGFGHNGVHDSCETEGKKLAIEEEVDHLYERLQALEADREFLKHCISSLKKGDKGTDLLQEILQHLRDLRNVELRVWNLSETSII